MDVIDIGCGTGILGIIANKFISNSKIYAIDNHVEAV